MEGRLRAVGLYRPARALESESPISEPRAGAGALLHWGAGMKSPGPAPGA